MLLTSFWIGCRTLAANPLRTILSTLGVIMGTGALVAVLSVGDGVEAFARRQIAETTDLQMLAVVPVTGGMVDGVYLPRRDTLTLDPADAESLHGALGPGATVALERSAPAELERLPGDSLRAALAVGLTAGPPTMEQVTLRSGRWFSANDVDSAAHLAIVSPRVARALTGDSASDPAGHTLVLQGRSYTVIGATRESATGAARVWVPFSAFPPVTTPAVASLLVRGATVEEMPALVTRTHAWVRSRWPGSDDRLTVQARGNRIEQVRQSMLIFKLLMGAITGISLLVGGVGIMNVLLASVLERTREIGVRRATGARRRDIRTQFLAESVVVTGAGSALGVVVGISVAMLTAAIMRSRTTAPIHAVLSLPTLLVAAVSAIVIGLAFGMYPALRASRLAPIDAIRHE